MISTSEIKISCIIDQEKSLQAMNELHNKFKLDKQYRDSKAV
jgi:aspartokinase